MLLGLDRILQIVSVLQMLKNKFIHKVLKSLFKTHQFNKRTMYQTGCFWSLYFKILELALLIWPHYCSLIKKSQNRIHLAFSIFQTTSSHEIRQDERNKVSVQLCTKRRLALHYACFECFQFNVLSHSNICSKHIACIEVTLKVNMYSFPHYLFISEYVKNDSNLKDGFVSTLVLSQTSKEK